MSSRTRFAVSIWCASGWSFPPTRPTSRGVLRSLSVLLVYVAIVPRPKVHAFSQQTALLCVTMIPVSISICLGVTGATAPTPQKRAQQPENRPSPHRCCNAMTWPRLTRSPPPSWFQLNPWIQGFASTTSSWLTTGPLWSTRAGRLIPRCCPLMRLRLGGWVRVDGAASGAGCRC
jgi:hypothetical protein